MSKSNVKEIIAVLWLILATLLSMAQGNIMLIALSLLMGITALLSAIYYPDKETK